MSVLNILFVGSDDVARSIAKKSDSRDVDNYVYKDLKEDGTFILDQKYFNYATGLTMTNNNFDKLFGQKPRKPDTENITQFHMDIAASIQSVTDTHVVVFSAIDNLIKGGSGQAIQNMNLKFNFPSSRGLK